MNRIEELMQNEKLDIDMSKVYFDEPMNIHTTFRVGGIGECYVKVHNIESLQTILNFANIHKIPITILGNGSNVLISDKGINGIILKIDLKQIEIIDNSVIVGAGFSLAMLAQKLWQNGLTGFEELAGIPGTVGGATRMNAGANGKEFKDIVKEIYCIDYHGNERKFENSEVEFEYRNSIFLREKYIITQAKLEFQRGNKKEIEEKMKMYFTQRKEKQPLEYPSAGSTFKRGNDFITAKLIDECGLKGTKVGGAEVSTKHAGFIVNKGNATANDILTLSKKVEEEVYKKYNKKIELEIELIGEFYN